MEVESRSVTLDSKAAGLTEENDQSTEQPQALAECIYPRDMLSFSAVRSPQQLNVPPLCLSLAD